MPCGIPSNSFVLLQVPLVREADLMIRGMHIRGEQLTYILSGALHFWFGARDGHEIVVRAGEVVVSPSHLLHRAVALEDTLDVDVFSPPRQDWLSGTDAYLRG